MAEEPPVPSQQDSGSIGVVTHPLAQEVLINPGQWSIWPAVAIMRWLLRTNPDLARRLVYRSQPSLSFAVSEIRDVALSELGIELTLSAPGLATAGTILPSSDIERIIADMKSPRGGALARWLDGPLDLFMQIVEAHRAHYRDSFAFSMGARAQSLRFVADVSGASALLSATRNGLLLSELDHAQHGAIGFSSQFVSATPSAEGLRSLIRAYTNLPCRVQEFTGARVRVLRPARLGGPLTRILGRHHELPSAGIHIIVNGGHRPEGADLVSQRTRRRSLHNLCTNYIGSPSVSAQVSVDIEPELINPAKLGEAEFGGMAVLGRPATRLRLPLAL